MSFEVYCITNLITNKKYIGITTQGFENRFKKHINEAMNGSERYLCKSFRKYGIENFKVELIDNEINSYKELLEKEIYYIEKYNSMMPNGYNMTLGGEGSLGRPMKQETREKMKKMKLGKTPWNKGKPGSQKGHWEGKKMPYEARLKMSIAKRGKKLSEETKKKRKYIYERMKGSNHPLYGVGHTEESKKKMSESKKGQGTTKYKAYNENATIVFNSLKEALLYLGVKGHSSLIKAERNKTIYKGYYWEKIN